MVWFFAAVVLVLAVLHRGFRVLIFWIGGIAAAITVIGLINTAASPSISAQSNPRVDATISRPNGDEFAGFAPAP